MKMLLVGVNASFSHTCLGIRSLYQYIQAKNKTEDCQFIELTINQPFGDLLRKICQQQPECILFSTYIWNAEIIRKIIPEIKKILPDSKIGAGGPEFGFAPEYYLNLLPDLDFIIKGEGEKSVYELFTLLQSLNFSESKSNKDFFTKLENINGFFYRENKDLSPKSQDSVIIKDTGAQELICNLDELPFPYSSFEPNKILYYESSRGCPYKCSYCMSSVEHQVRFKSLEKVFADLQIFLDAKVPLVKFVDRTYNLKEDRYLAIWQYIIDHHNGITMFHFEIEAEYLSKNALEFLQKVPEGVMQFEIGVQSANKKTLQAVNRSPNVEKLAENIRQLPKTIHQHLDLIAGLPYEDLNSFGKSFDFVMALKPDALQLGFLKVLHGTQMEAYAKSNGWKWMENPVYETLSTPYLSYDDILFLKDLEIMVDSYWNSGHFYNFMTYVMTQTGAWNFFTAVTEFARNNNIFDLAHKEAFWFELMGTELLKAQSNEKSFFTDYKIFENSNILVMYELLRYDFILRGKQGNFPLWYKRNYNKDLHLQFMSEVEGDSKLGFAKTDFEQFAINVDNPFDELVPCNKLFVYK